MYAVVKLSVRDSILSADVVVADYKFIESAETFRTDYLKVYPFPQMLQVIQYDSNETGDTSLQ